MLRQMPEIDSLKLTSFCVFPTLPLSKDSVPISPAVTRRSWPCPEGTVTEKTQSIKLPPLKQAGMSPERYFSVGGYYSHSGLLWDSL